MGTAYPLDGLWRALGVDAALRTALYRPRTDSRRSTHEFRPITCPRSAEPGVVSLSEFCGGTRGDVGRGDQTGEVRRMQLRG